MAEAELHITVKHAGDPGKLGALVSAAVAMLEQSVQNVIPNGYKCIECYKEDGTHERWCAFNAGPTVAPVTGPTEQAEPTEQLETNTRPSNESIPQAEDRGNGSNE